MHAIHVYINHIFQNFNTFSSIFTFCFLFKTLNAFFWKLMVESYMHCQIIKKIIFISQSFLLKIMAYLTLLGIKQLNIW